MPGGVIDTLRVVYTVDVADKGTKGLLASERAVQKSVIQTSRELAKHDLAVKRSAVSTAAAAKKNSAALREQTRASEYSAAGATKLMQTQKAGAATAEKVAWSAKQVTVAYNEQTAAAGRLTAAERAQAAAIRTTQAARAKASAAASKLGALGRGGAGGIAAAGAVAARGLKGVTGGGIIAGALGLGAVIKQTVDFDKAMRNVNSIAQLSEGRFKELGKSVRELAGQTAQAPKTLAEGLYDLVSSGFDAKQSMVILRQSAKAATAGLTDTATSTKAVAAVLNAYHRPAKDAANISDTLFQTVNKGVISFEQLSSTIGDVLPFASSLGVGLDQVGASVSTLTKAGISPEETMTRIKNVMVTMLKPSDALQHSFDKLGVSSGEALIKQKGFQGALEAVTGTTDGSKAAIAKLFPNIRALGGALALTGKNAKGAESDLSSFKDVTGATDKALSQQSKSLAFQWQSLKAQASSLAIGLGGKLVPAFSGVLGKMNALVRGKGAVAGVLKDLAAGLRGDQPTGSRLARRSEAAGAGAVGEHALGNVANRVLNHQDAMEKRARDRIGSSSSDTARDANARRLKQIADARKPPPVSDATKIGTTIRGVIKTVADEAKRLGPVLLTAGRQLVGAFKPAMPFLRNVLLPLIKGIGQGVIVSIVAAFKIAVPIIKTVATVLGFIGTAARPLRGVFAGIGTVLGFLVSGPILKVLSMIPKVGIVFRLLALPIRAVIGIVKGVIGIFGKLPGTVTGALGKIPGKVGGIIGSVASSFAKLGKGIVSAIVNAIKSAPGAIVDAVKSIIPGPIRGLIGKAGGAIKGLFGGRKGGRVPRFQGGGLVPIVASGGEMMVHGGQSMMIPGPSDRDGTPMLAPAGAAILTGSGQAMMAGGASLSQALAGQAPHFMSGGRVAGLARGVGFKGVDLVRALAVAKAESRWSESARHVNKNGTIDRGLWQINSVHGPLSTFDPEGNARAAYKISGGGKNWRPWSTFKSGVYNRYMDAARTAVTGSRGKTDAPTIFGAARRRAGLIDDAFAQGQQAGQAGLTRGVIKTEGNPILKAIADAIAGAGTQSDKGGASSSTSQGDTGGFPSGSAIGKMNAQASSINAKHYQYAWGGGHGSIGQPSSGTRTSHGGARGIGYDCSGAVSAVLGAGGLLKSPETSGALMGWGHKGSGKRLGVYADAKHVIMRIGQRFFGTGEANPNGGAGWLPGNTMAGRGVVRTWPGMRRGGRVGFRAGGVVAKFTGGGASSATTTGNRLSGALSNAMGNAGGSLEALDNIIGVSLQTRLVALREQVTAQVRKGGAAKTVQRLQSVLDLIDFELGRRVGRIQDVVEKRSANLDRMAGATDRMMRAQGIDGGSTRGIGVLQVQQAAESTVRKQNVASLTAALRTATAAKNRQAIAEITGQLNDAQDALAESLTKQIELFRDQVRALGTEAVGNSQFSLGMNQTGAAMLQAQQRLNGTQDSPGALREQAGALQGGVIPALQADVAAKQFNAQMLGAIGDLDGWRSAVQDAASAAVDLANAQADAMDLLRQAAEKDAQDRVDSATHGRTMSDLGLQKLDLEQQLIGTHDTAGGAQGRADFIRQQILPAIQGELAALIAQQQTAQAQGDAQLALQIGEAVAAKQNEVLQAQLDAQNEIKANTADLKEFGGSTAFSYQGQSFVDVNAARVGA